MVGASNKKALCFANVNIIEEYGKIPFFMLFHMFIDNNSSYFRPICCLFA